ncbi:MAG: YbaK/EbsC family protein [Caldilinea sp.]|uniref:aminoacyl-tRNA deacylase n=1 Tax=Caldilinea sp. TaxID=2293560 RepID=UPI002C0596F2|nr:YbaK/EbsC family protein [Anaerolineales bacterium]HQY90520.1 YbaK/EbsC family protein [Caldilinea sp.]HRA66694.1 YbaK/EbsC family protein [Caldilinea sp.]
MEPSYWTPVDLQRFLDEYAIQAELLPNIGHTPTVPAAAMALGVAPDQIIKTLLFLVEQLAAVAPTPVVVISHGERRVDTRLLAEHFGVGKKRVTLAPADVVLATLGYPAGGVPPFGHATHLPVIVDASVQTVKAGVIFGGGGDDRTMLRLTVAELLRVTGAEVVAMS